MGIFTSQNHKKSGNFVNCNFEEVEEEEETETEGIEEN